MSSSCFRSVKTRKPQMSHRETHRTSSPGTGRGSKCCRVAHSASTSVANGCSQPQVFPQMAGKQIKKTFALQTSFFSIIFPDYFFELLGSLWVFILSLWDLEYFRATNVEKMLGLKPGRRHTLLPESPISLERLEAWRSGPVAPFLGQEDGAQPSSIK